MTDARYEDGDEHPLRLIARDGDSLTILAALVQDAVLPAAEMTFSRPRRRFALMLNRFRWEDEAAAKAARRPFERVQSLLVVDEVLAVRSQGVARDPDTVLSLLEISFDGAEDGAGHVTLTFAGDGALQLTVEALEITLRDVSRPYAAVSGKVPGHEG